jgi:hypothetical protein
MRSRPGIGYLKAQKIHGSILNCFQITKAMLVQNHERSAFFFNRMFKLFEDNTMSWDAARLLGKLGGSDGILTKRKHADVKVGRSRGRYQSIQSVT